jgi:hypothetical protein
MTFAGRPPDHPSLALILFETLRTCTTFVVFVY